jgi:broad specificity phosphatase PhoE
VTTLLLIRHGQASLGAADYDVLSALGAQQAQRLGSYLARMSAPPTAIYSGPLRRQVDTAAHLVAAARAAGADYPSPRIDAAFDEYPAIAVMQQHLQRLAQEDPELAPHWEGLQRHERGSLEHRRAFEAAFQRMMRHWHDDRLADPGIERCADFVARVERGLTALLAAHGRGATVLVVTSAGPIGVGLGLGLALSAWAALQASFVVANSSLTELKSRGEPPVLTMFNALPHLVDRREFTLR